MRPSTAAKKAGSGWTAGGGFEFAVSPNITWKTEYLYVNLGSDTHSLVAVTAAGIGLNIAPASFIVSGRKADFSLARVGLNYRFDPPVVAKY